MKNKRFFLLLFLTLLLTGCWDSKEPERMLYVNALGVDFKDEQYEVYAQIISFANVAKTELPTTDQPQAEVGYSKGKSLNEAVINLYHSMDQTVFWGHFSYVVISEEAMNNMKFSPVIDSLVRYRETRYQIWVYVTKDSVQDVLLVRPVLNRAITLSNLNDPEAGYSQESYIKPMNFREVIIDMDEPGHEALIPLISIEGNWKSNKEMIDAPVLSGVGVVTPNGFKGYIEGDKARGLQWMTNDTERGQVTFKTNDDSYTTTIIEKMKVNIQPIVESSTIRFDVAVDMEVTLDVVEGKVTADDVEKGVKKEVENQIKATFEEAIKMDVDVYRFSEQLYRKNVNAWKKHQKDGKIELNEDSIRNLTVHISQLKSDRKSFKETIEKE
ncbi:Ger(x)C family spore germination protein [Sporosarcina siberiensis]|uniref:Ger(X)C family spore germination protein n=1 Tax=Sporosarcina siberiensis TaxID=1365606 RepID=A0ABW4SKX5_9BACL